ncbi:MAG: hypothetical protein ACOC22_02370 [bacterium]
MSRLLENSPEYRDAQISRNTFNKNDTYNVSHPDALSDGDEIGKGELNSQVGSLTDIKSKERMVAKNIYNQNNEYNISNA